MTGKSAESGDRLTQLEIQLAHVQRLYEQLNEVVTEEAMRADKLQRKVDALTMQLKDIKQKSTEPTGDPREEKPPHY